MKMQRMKDFAMGAIISALVVGTTPVALAKAGLVNIPVQYSNIKVAVDGNELSTSKEPFIYDGTTYLPLRAVAEAVGMDVSWDNTTKTANLMSKSATVEIPVEKPKEEKQKSERMGEIESKNKVYAENVEIICKGVEEVNDIFGGIQLNFKLKNPSSQNYTVSTKKVSVNGMKVDSSMYVSLNNDRDLEENLRIYEKDLKDAGITQIRKVEIEFSIWNKDSYDDYKKNMVIQFKY